MMRFNMFGVCQKMYHIRIGAPLSIDAEHRPVRVVPQLWKVMPGGGQVRACRLMHGCTGVCECT